MKGAVNAAAATALGTRPVGVQGSVVHVAQVIGSRAFREIGQRLIDADDVFSID